MVSTLENWHLIEGCFYIETQHMKLWLWVWVADSKRQKETWGKLEKLRGKYYSILENEQPMSYE